MSLIPPELLLAKNKREEAARIAGDNALRGLIVSANGNVDDLIKAIKGQTVIVRRIENEFTAQVEDVSARIYSLETVGISDRAAFIEQLQSISVSVGSARNAALAAQASIDEYKIVAAELGTAVAQQVVKLRSQVGDNHASIKEETITRASETEALALRSTTLESQVQTPLTGLLARVTVVESTYATTSYVTASIATAIGAIVGGSNITVAGSAPGSPAVDDLWIDTSDLDKPKYWDGASWVYRPDGSVATAASVSALSTAMATADGYATGKYTLKVVAGNVVTGMNITSSTGAGTDVSDVIFQAANFKVYNGTSGVAPFQVIGGVVRVSSLSITSSDVSGLAATATSADFANVTGATKPANNADVTLAAINGGLVITSGGITLNGSPSIQSNNYVAGTSGWQIDGAGNAEFQNVTVRGTLNANDLVAGTIPIPRLPAGIGEPLAYVGGASTISGTSPTLITALQLSGVTMPGTTKLVLWSGYIANASGGSNDITVQIFRDGGSIVSTQAVTLAAGVSFNTALVAVDTPSAGSHNYAVYAFGSNANNIVVGGQFIIS